MPVDEPSTTTVALVSQGESSDDDIPDDFDNPQPPFFDASADGKDEAERARQTDAVLSCPACLKIVCLDCQRHVNFPDQFRAMFVRNIAVQWEKKLHLHATKGLIEHEKQNSSEREVYHPVVCASCQTLVAALERNEEVYHFYGCVASS